MDEKELTDKLEQLQTELSDSMMTIQDGDDAIYVVDKALEFIQRDSGIPEPNPWSRDKDREIEGEIIRWRHQEDDAEIVIKRDAKHYDVLEKVGGYTNHEIATAVSDIHTAVEKAVDYMEN